MYNKIMFLTET